ncbi:hypothetical protein BTO16_05805 [Polaribacter glomeratus]|uniref:HTH araC/xylS-type domain-containing protein n=1 Tax=Polaribacter glomeratus TaxID=102 RepID=A0A2S7WZH5_9FLAO|nr:hypothetical protein BTO16_05805 [Polaribacter glomeratus]TXD66935.1 AraC family transcriptional regulator [Polaribacter glomeratus]
MIETFIFLITAIIGFVTLALLLRSYRSNPFCNFFLIIIIGVISYRFFVHGTYYLGLQSILKPVTGSYSIFYLVLIPCFYLYYKYLTIQVKSFSFKDLKHLIFIVFLFLINSIETLDNTVIFHFGPMTNFFFVAIFILFYLIITFKLLIKKIWFRKNLLLNTEHFNLIKNWTIYFSIINALCALSLLASIYKEFNNGISVSGKSLAIFGLLFWVFIFFKILISPEILYGLPILNSTLLKFNGPLIEEKVPVLVQNNNWVFETNTTKSDQDQRLQENIRANIESYSKEVDLLSKEKLIFRNPKMSQSDVAEKLGVPTSHIVYLFKYHSKISFSEYRTNARIQDAILMIKENFLNTETLESLAYKSGFASYNPFYIAFKKVTTYSPQEYLKRKNT